MMPKEIITAYLEALGKGDIAVAFSYFSTDAQWHQPGSHQFAGLKTGPKEIGEMVGGMMEATQGTFALKPIGNLMINGNMVALPVNFTGTIEDRTMDMTGVDLFEVKDGKIINVWLFSDDQELENKFWGE
ncbi:MULTISPECIES: nuclear transport factor 2 family protein [unclassified Pedobacter]|uniref:nuclear transport factor 2 family protein n=1 Tax=unclassified Pedobacter TaxID=2628915 RepID=UPI001E3F9C73|nr:MULTISPECIES: nuclear transport factor 2 family protein [unclassified Pedobacter]